MNTLAASDVYTALTLGTVRVELDFIGEGYGGDYDPDDAEDTQLLRISVLAQNLEGEWEIVENGSTCTNLDATRTSPGARTFIVMGAMTAVKDTIDAGGSVKRAVEEMSLLPFVLADSQLDETAVRLLRLAADSVLGA